jgi:hypothetical protein
MYIVDIHTYICTLTFYPLEEGVRIWIWESKFQPLRNSKMFLNRDILTESLENPDAFGKQPKQ